MEKTFGPRINREMRTVTAMIELYCHDHHVPHTGLCDDCQLIHTYAMERLRRCPFQEGKTTCAHCEVHCYRAQMRDRIREIMRYAGPRMMWHHPLLAVRHLMDGRRKIAIRPSRPNRVPAAPQLKRESIE